MRLLWISNDPRLDGIGQSRVTREILGRLHGPGTGIEAHAIAMGPDNHRAWEVPYMVHPWGLERHEYPKVLIESLKPDMVVCSHDPWNFYWTADCRKDFPNTKLVGYYTIDGGPIHESWRTAMKPLDLLAVPTQFGKQEIYRRYPEKSVAVIPYGVDHTRFTDPGSKIGRQRKADQESTTKSLKLEGKTVFLSVGHNQNRKNTACVLDAFEMADIPNSHLFLVVHSRLQHIGGWSGMGDFDLPDMVHMCSTRNRVTVVTGGLSDPDLSALYQVSDYFLFPSLAECPGLPLLEAMASGCVPITTNYSGGAEIVGDDGYLLPYTPLRGQFNVVCAVVDPLDLAMKMRECVELSLDERVGMQARAVARARQFSWDKTAKLWAEYIMGVMGGETLVETELQGCLP
jgi:glycosyltransferase involved in cell wall biosynthesis